MCVSKQCVCSTLPQSITFSCAIVVDTLGSCTEVCSTLFSLSKVGGGRGWGRAGGVRQAMYGILLLEYCVTGTLHTCISTTFPVHCTLYTTCVWASVVARVCQHAIVGDQVKRHDGSWCKASTVTHH